MCLCIDIVAVHRCYDCDWFLRYIIKTFLVSRLNCLWYNAESPNFSYCLLSSAELSLNKWLLPDLSQDVNPAEASKVVKTTVVFRQMCCQIRQMAPSTGISHVTTSRLT